MRILRIYSLYSHGNSRHSYCYLMLAKKFIGLKVETKSGQKLGKVKDFELDEISLDLKKIYVRPNSYVKGFVVGDLIIDKSSIVSVSEEKIVVEDLNEREFAKIEEYGKKLAGSQPILAADIK